jgi:hypothetical protein
MFPMMWSQPACRNIDERSVSQVNVAGTRPSRNMNAWRAGAGIDSSNQKTSALTRMIPTVTYGVVLEGMTSRRGITSRVYGTVPIEGDCGLSEALRVRYQGLVVRPSFLHPLADR